MLNELHGSGAALNETWSHLPTFSHIKTYILGSEEPLIYIPQNMVLDAAIFLPDRAHQTGNTGG